MLKVPKSIADCEGAIYPSTELQSDDDSRSNWELPLVSGFSGPSSRPRDLTL